MPDFNDARLTNGRSPVFFRAGQGPAPEPAEIDPVKTVAGPPGPQGPVGPQGPQGLQGEKGDKGDQGIQGPIGPQGEQGPQGVKGDKGDQGDTGPQGPIGPQGPQGPQGLQGIQGIQGNVGAKGDKGDPGSKLASAVINPQQHLILTSEDGDVFDAGFIPEGPEGPQGPQGPQGIQGNVGPQGIQGVQGPIGPMGPMGVAYENVILLNNQSGTVNLDLSGTSHSITNGGGLFFSITMGGPITVNLTGMTQTNRTYTAVIAIKQRSTGGAGVTWPAAVITPGDTAYIQTATANATDVYTVFAFHNGSAWQYHLNQIGQDYR